MDELLHHCLRELAFDGDLGSDVSRLRDFVVDFYAHANATHTQNLDDAFCSFVWSLVVQQSIVLVGLVPRGVTSEVWIAPQVSAKRKAKARGEDHMESTPPKLEPIPDPKTTSLDSLRTAYGDRLRLAAEPDAIFAAITGSHIRTSKMSPMVYSALQIITRGRAAGVTVVELGKQSGYDQKTCFYLVRQLTELDLVVKVRRGGVGTHFCIHKYFFERSSSWKAIRDEETQAESSQIKYQSTEVDLADDENNTEENQSLSFTPIDARHLSSLPLISARVIRLLKASRNHIHASNNILITLGFSNPTKTDRRFFQSRIREMIQQRLIEKVVVPSNRKKSPNASVKCFRLVEQEACTPADNELILPDPDDDMDDLAPVSQNGIKLNSTIHKQIIDLLEYSGTTGMTLNGLSASLCQFDKRTIELLLARADKFRPPPHLSDLHIVGLMETSGRERRHRYYTVANYRKLVALEELDKASAGYGDIDLDNVGGFHAVASDSFYETEKDLVRYSDTFKGDERSHTSKPGKRLLKNPILADGTVKRGRPRKSDTTDLNDTHLLQSAPRVKRKRKASSPIPLQEEIMPSEHSNEDREIHSFQEPSDQPKPAKRGRGRPPKVKNPPLQVASPAHESQSISVPKARGRRLRNAPTEEVSSASHKKVSELTRFESLLASPQLEDLQNIEIPSYDEVNEQVPRLSSPSPQINPGTSGLEHDLLPDSDSGPGTPAQNTSREGMPLSASIPSHGAVIFDASITPNPSPPKTRPVIESSRTPSSPKDSNIDESSNLQNNHAGRIEAEKTAAPDLQPNSSISPSTSTPLLNINRVNVSHLRRENELLRLIENAGGIFNMQTKEFYEAHMKLLDSLAQAGEPTSAPVGTRTDKRTMVSTFNSLERKGRIKQLKTSVTSHTGLHRPACIVYLPQIDQAQLNAFLAELARGSQPASQLNSFVKIDQRVDYGASSSSSSRGVLPLQLLQMEQPGSDEKERWSKNISRANQLFSYNDTTIRDVFLAERTTMAQLYGFIIGKAMRCRHLHLSTLRALESLDPSPHIISQEKRIVDLSFFCYDLPLELYCSLVSPLSYNEELTSFLATKEGRATLVRNLPQLLQSSLQVGRSRARSRFLDMLQILRSLGLVSPLRPSTSETPFVICSPHGEHPTHFDIAALDDWTANTPTIAPVYWHFHETTPIHLWVVSETQPPCWKNVSVTTYDDGIAYWEDLYKACTNSQINPGSEDTRQNQTSTASVSAARSLRRTASWRSDYFLTWHQIQYLKQFVDPSSGSTPLQTSDEREKSAQLDKICWVTSAPREVVENYFSSSMEKLSKSLERMRQKATRDKKRTEDAKISLAKKAEDARLQREQEWIELLHSIHPEDLTAPAVVRMERVRSHFLQAVSIKDISKWEQEIQAALREAEMASTKGLKISTKRIPDKQPFTLPAPPSVVPVVHSERSVQDLIELQGPPIQHTLLNVKRKRKKNTCADIEDPKKNIRRHRFQWNKNFDELARDAAAIIRARCRNLPRLDWAAFEQVFPAVPRNTVRQRLSHIKETPGNEAYLRRLEDTWYDLWTKYKGTPLLPDDDDKSAFNFDLVKHVEFLRTHVDKNALRVGFGHATETATVVIPPDFQQLQQFFEPIQVDRLVPDWDFMWNALIEEGREKKLKRQVISLHPEEFPPRLASETDDIILAEAALKMVMGTPPELYESEQASSLLKSRGDEHINIATKNLLSRGVLSKSQRDPKKQRPGRQLKISESNQNAIGGSITRDTFQDAVSLLEEMDVNDSNWHEWPLTATDGDCATLVQLVSEDKVDFNIDTSLPQSARPALDWNSKKADDDQIETAISVRYQFSTETQNSLLDGSQMTPAPFEHSPELSDSLGVETGHESNVNGAPACCRRKSMTGLVDCMACLNDAWDNFLKPLDTEARIHAEWVNEAVRQAGEAGIKKAELAASAGTQKTPLSTVVNQMIEASIPQIYWTGYDSLILVSAHYVASWSVVVAKDPVIRIFPRRWLDIRGYRIADFWQAALRAVIGLVIFRPGISQAEIRWRLRSVYDRQELNEILRFLYEEGYLRLRLGYSSKWATGDIFAPFDEDEEGRAYWFIGDKHWYQV